MKTYGAGFTTTRDGEPAIMSRVGWFARVILRRKPKPIVIPHEVARVLAAMARKNGEDLVREIFANRRADAKK